MGCDGGVDATPAPSAAGSKTTSPRFGPVHAGGSSGSGLARNGAAMQLHLDQFVLSPPTPPSRRSSTTASATSSNQSSPALVSTTDEDPRVLRLLQEAELWSPASHALWTVWGIVQAKEDLLKRIHLWKAQCASGIQGGESETVETDFDYLSYSLGRMALFRKELKDLDVVD